MVKNHQFSFREKTFKTRAFCQNAKINPTLWENGKGMIPDATAATMLNVTRKTVGVIKKQLIESGELSTPGM